MVRTALLSCCIVAAVACGGGQPPPAASPSSGEQADAGAPQGEAPAPTGAAGEDGGAPAVEAPGPGQWVSWSKDQRAAYMKSAVLPKMGALFHDFDAKDFAQPKCTLCHGEGAKNGTFTMPNPGLPKLPTTAEGFRKLHDQHPKIVDFMVKQVEPTMAGLLGETPYDPKTGQGFGCFHCHTKR